MSNVNKSIVPRIRGAAFQHKGSISWGWEMIITFGDMKIDDPEAMVINNGDQQFINKKSAIKAMQKHAIKVTDIVGEALGEKNLSDNGFIDLRKGFNKVTKEEFTNNI
ncbi:MAG: hypothetical protein ACPGJV_02605 [Bacteriovoracaceae bacterium]